MINKHLKSLTIPFLERKMSIESIYFHISDWISQNLDNQKLHRIREIAKLTYKGTTLILLLYFITHRGYIKKIIFRSNK